MRQQLQILAEERIFLQGQLWPQQPFEWELWPDEKKQNHTPSEQLAWNSRMHLSLPRLGQIQVTLKLHNNRLHLQFLNTQENTTAELNQSQHQLLEQLQQKNISLEYWHTQTLDENSSS